MTRTERRTAWDVLVIGGGITGVTAALRAAQAGADVLLVEADELGAAASGRNAGSLHAQIQQASYLAGGDAWARGWAPSLHLLRDALAIWRTLGDELGVDLELKQGGGLLVAETPEQLRVIERKVAIEREWGIDSRMLGRDEIHALAPYLSERIVGGELCADEGKASPLKAVPALAVAAVAAGATLRRHTPVLSLRRVGDGFAARTARETIQARRVILATGSELPRLAAMVGVEVAVTGEPMQVSVTEAIAPLIGQLVYYAAGPLTLKQSAAGTVLIGGGWPARVHPAHGRPAVDLDGMRRNLALALRVAPAIGSARVIRTWTGTNNATPDQRPVIGAADGLAFGTFPYLGFTAGPLMGELLARLALGRDPGRDLSPFAHDRF